jgi:hypothetical protein
VNVESVNVSLLVPNLIARWRKDGADDETIRRDLLSGTFDRFVNGEPQGQGPVSDVTTRDGGRVSRDHLVAAIVTQVRKTLGPARAAAPPELIGWSPTGGPIYSAEDGMNPRDVLKRLQTDPETVSEQERDAAIEAVASQLFPTALAQQRDQNPNMPLGEIAKRARIAARGAAVELEPVLATPVGRVAVDISKAVADEASAWAELESVADRLQAKDARLTRPAAISKALLDPSGVSAYRRYVRAQQDAAAARQAGQR